ncbi:zinc finger protein VAR3, chloroplastic-like isoform X2 [Cynara cardunculus var. scolymus]|uniref:zinc finger protein VAR3, chloroplastic-like isoform X2 n=1 Tax=Cynara cardunculus var. scolymus TaxID=59895 RepID=UPI000D62FE37|nr:zinc finger protein VAR3, chloroplastic-like isoform X2 [Cynara cardunculus var. scolymus]
MFQNLSQTLKSLPKSVISISYLHTRNKTLISNPAINFILDEFEDLQSSNPVSISTQQAPKTAEPVDSGSSSIQNEQEWPEWVGLMEKLMKNGYFDGVGNPFRSGGLIDGKGCNQIRTACLNFARDRPGLMSHLKNRDIQTVAGSGCPSMDRKVVNSGKRLRAHMSIDEGNVCSSCILRGNCERAHVKAREDEGGRTVDVMRLVLTYGLNHITSSDVSEPFLNKRLEEAIRSLIKDMVKFSKDELDYDNSKRVPSVHRSPTQQQEHISIVSTTQSDWNCPKCKFLNFARNVKCKVCNSLLFHERHQGSWNSREFSQLKKGDWLCIRCHFLNFAKNTRCLQCHTNPPKRQLNPGEWECDSCNYINFKRNMVCLKCDHKRPKAFNNSTS